MKAKLTIRCEIEYEVCEALDILADPQLCVEQVHMDAEMLRTGELSIEDWPPKQVRILEVQGIAYGLDGYIIAPTPHGQPEQDGAGQDETTGT